MNQSRDLLLSSPLFTYVIMRLNHCVLNMNFKEFGYTTHVYLGENNPSTGYQTFLR